MTLKIAMTPDFNIVVLQTEQSGTYLYKQEVEIILQQHYFKFFCLSNVIFNSCIEQKELSHKSNHLYFRKKRSIIDE